MTSLYSETSTQDGAPLYRAVDVSRVLEDRDIADRIGIAADIIQGTYQTGFEVDLNYFAQRGYAGQPTRAAILSPLSSSLHQKTVQLATEFRQEHQALMEEALGEASSLQEAFPNLLYAIGQNRAGTFQFGDPVKVSGFEVLSGKLRSTYDVDPLSLSLLALCDIRNLNKALQKSLQKHIW